jgi:hypothetical protein
MRVRKGREFRGTCLLGGESSLMTKGTFGTLRSPATKTYRF